MKRIKLNIKQSFIKKTISFFMVATIITANMPIGVIKKGRDVYAADLTYETGGSTLTYKVLLNNTIQITGCGENDTNIVIPQKIEGKEIISIGVYAFDGMNNLKSVELPEGLEEIEYSAFNNCDGLTEIKLPESLKTMGQFAFANCDRLDKIYFFGSAPTVGSSFIPNKDTICAYYNPYDGDWSDVISKADKVNWIEFDGENITEVKLFSINPIGNLKVGESVELLASTYVNGDFADEQGTLSFVIADTSIVDYDGFRKTEDGTMITLHAKSKGTTVLTVTDNDTGKKTYTSISVDDYGINLLADNMPVFNDNGAEYNAYVSGMYISNFTKSKLGTSYYRIEMDIYNSKQCYGSVDVYDSNHQLKYSKKIDKHSGGNLTSIKDTILATGNLASDVWNLNILSFKNSAYTTPTHIDITVPVGGYIEIGNNIDKLPSSSIYNNCDLLSFALMKHLSLYKNNVTIQNLLSKDNICISI